MSIHEENPEVALLTAQLSRICSLANQQIDALPRPTRKKLTEETRKIFTKYSEHGSQQRLRHDLTEFLKKSDAGLDLTSICLPYSLQPPQTSRAIDPESRPLVRELPFHIDQTFEICPDVNLPPSLFLHLDRIFGLYAEEAKALLRHHCEKYGDEPVFRAGIREYMESQLSSILESTRSDSLSLTPETREFLRSVYEHSPELNIAEKRMLSRATRLDIDAIEVFWEDMAVRRRAYMAMRAFVAARELEKAEAEKAAAATRAGQ